jgi:DNA-binding HxlR family transcriptional regulator
MLTVTLRHLERDGIVERTAYPTVPVTVEYCLTPLGKTLIHSVNALVGWSAEHEREMRGHAQRSFQTKVRYLFYEGRGRIRWSTMVQKTR